MYTNFIKPLIDRVRLKIVLFRRNPFFSRIGQITILHASLEQELKIHLLILYGFDYFKNSSGAVRDKLVKEISQDPRINEELKNYVLKLLDDYKHASDKRNAILKTSYDLSDPGKILDTGYQHWHLKRGFRSFSELQLSELEGLLDELLLLHLNLRPNLQLCCQSHSN